MNEAWQILGLDPSSATERDVKSAYARLLKQHRPDQDPEGFRRIRDAYDAVMAALKLRASEETPKIPATTTDSTAKDFALEAALLRKDLAAVSGALDEIQETNEGRSEGERGTGPWPAIMGEHLPWLASAVDDERLITWMAEGKTWVVQLVFGQWEKDEKTDRMLSFVEAVSQNMNRVDGHESLMFAYELACWVAFWSRPLASQMGNAVFAKLPPVGRESLLESLEEHMDLGRWFEEATSETRRFLWIHLRLADRAWDWNSEASEKALAEIAEGIDRYCSPIEIWRPQIPPEAWQKLESMTEQMRDRGADAALMKGDSFWFRSVWHGIFGAFLLMGAFLGLAWILSWLGGWLAPYFESKR